MKDYFGNEIKIGDVLLYNQKAVKGYYGSFSEGTVTGFRDGRKEILMNGQTRHGRYAENTVDLTALGLREVGAQNES